MVRTYLAAHAWSDGIQSGLGNEVVSIDGPLTHQAIKDIERTIRDKRNFESCAIVNLIELEDATCEPEL